jgi:hypothetical protein
MQRLTERMHALVSRPLTISPLNRRVSWAGRPYRGALCPVEIKGMGTIVRFPEGQRPLGSGRYVDSHSEPADVIILPVVRIERKPDHPSDDFEGGAGAASGRRRRRRASRP